MNKTALKEYLNCKYQGSRSFLKTIIFPIFGEEDFEDGYDTELLESQPEQKHLATLTGINSVKLVGSVVVGVEPLQIFDITVTDYVMMERNRVNIQRLVRNVMDQYSCAFMIFHYDNDSRWDWRFTYCRKSGNQDETTNSKRYTFLLGPNQTCRTATDNFMSLYEKREMIDIKDIETAFDVEALSKEFFTKYKHHYERFVFYMCDEKNCMRKNFIDTKFDKTGLSAVKIKEKEEKPIRDYVKKLLGRIVFLHFLQKKGWMGVPEDKNWGEGDPQFMKHLFEKASKKQKDNYLDEVLEPLFSKGIDTDRTSRNSLYDTHIALDYGSVVKIPYLNGGLFERDKLDEPNTKFPADYFADLLEFFYQYNFTIDENDPNDAQIGVDPEMLGRIFENLLEDNKDKGAFYTPKEIVQYMCRQSLIAYLQKDIDDNNTKESLESFVKTYNVSVLGGAESELAKHVDCLLKEVKICDPAIGSGAFPMGLLKELFMCRGAIEQFDDPASIKRHIIQQNIYGVDIEKGAVDIARLRFWLSLVVDESSPQSLPNLDYKIMQGNSLLEQYNGVDFSKLTMLKKEKSASGFTLTMFDDMNDVYSKQLRDKLEEYYGCTDHTEKKNLIHEIREIIQKLADVNGYNIDLSTLNIESNDKFFLWHTWFSDVFNRPSDCNGFNIVIGNPPYGAKLSEKDKKAVKRCYCTTETIANVQKGSIDTYTLFLELAYNLLGVDGCMAMIVPISITSSDSLSGVHRLLLNNCDDIHVSSYAVRPQPVFENAVVNTSIITLKKTNRKCEHIYATKMYRKGRNFDLQFLVDNLEFVDVGKYLLFGRIPKISSAIEMSILNKLSKFSLLEDYIREKGKAIIYRFAGGRYFKIVTNYSNGSSAEREIYFEPKIADSIGCILSSNLSFWFYQIYSDNLNWKNYEIGHFRIPKLDDNVIKQLNSLYKIYLKDIEINANIRHTSGTSSYNVSSFKEYKIGKSKSIIDKIDDILCPLYGLTPEESEFIKNYEIEFRMSCEE